MGQFPITRTTSPKQKPADDTLTFGKVTTDHMFLMNYEEGKGWFNPRIEPYGPLSLDQGLELRRVAHGDGARVVRHLLAGGVVVTIDRKGFHAQALQRNQHFLAQLARPQQHDFGGMGRQGGSKGGHGGCFRKSGRKIEATDGGCAHRPRVGGDFKRWSHSTAGAVVRTANIAQ